MTVDFYEKVNQSKHKFETELMHMLMKLQQKEDVDFR